MKKRIISNAFLIVIFIIGIYSFIAHKTLLADVEIAQPEDSLMWRENGVPVCVTDDEQEDIRIVPDNNSGAIIVWKNLFGDESELRAQRIDAGGRRMWMPEEGVLIYDNIREATNYCITSNNNGGAIIVWEDGPRDGSDIYAQNIDEDGNLLWDPNGIAICTAPGSQYAPDILSDNDGNAIIVWTDYRGRNTDIFAHRIDPEGQKIWNVRNGIPIATRFDNQTNPHIFADGNGGAIITWQDYMRDDVRPYDILYGIIRAQRINDNGEKLWNPDSIAIGASGWLPTKYDLIHNNNGGFILVTETGGIEPFERIDISVRYFDSNGERQDTFDILGRQRVRWHRRRANHRCPRLISDASGNIIVLRHEHNQNNYSIYLTKINSERRILGEVLIGSTAMVGNNFPTELVSDGNGGAIVIWKDNISNEFRIQHVDTNGDLQFPENGFRVGNGNELAGKPGIITDGTGGAITTWLDTRNNNKDIFAQRIKGLNNLGFELGNFNYWTISDNAHNERNTRVITDLEGEVESYEGNYMGFISNLLQPEGEEVTITSPWITVPEEGCYISFRWKLLTSEFPGNNNIYNDTFIIREEIEGLRTTELSVGVNCCFESGWFMENNVAGFQHATRFKVLRHRLFCPPGSRVRFHFSVKNIGDDQVSTAVLIDDIRIAVR